MQTIQIKDWHIIWEINTKRLKDWIYEFNFKKIYKDRTLLQNNFYHWVIVKILSNELWYTNIETHELLKLMFLSKKYKLKWSKKWIKKTWSTTELTTIEFEKFLDDIRDYFKYTDKTKTKIWIELPYPNNETEMKRLINFYKDNF